MKTLLNPFKLFAAIFILTLKLSGYTLTFLIQAISYSTRGNRDGITNAIGWYGRCVTEAVAKSFE
jgi:hypothetical protein